MKLISVLTTMLLAPLAALHPTPARSVQEPLSDSMARGTQKAERSEEKNYVFMI